MVSRAPSSESPTPVTPAEPTRVSPAHRVAACLVTLSLAIPPGAVYSAPAEQVPLEYFAQDQALAMAESAEDAPPAAEGNAPAEPQPQAADWKPGDPPPAAPQGETAQPQGDLAPPDGVPVHAPTPAAGAPQALPGMPLEAGNCVITGEVSDATSLDPIADAFVDVTGTGRTAQTDASGKFRIDGLPPGSYTLEATKLGFFAETSVVTAIEAQPAEARFGLRLKPTDDAAEETTLEEETIVGEYTGDSAGDFNLDLMSDTTTVTSGISKEEFTKTGVSDAAGAVGKIAGANIVGGKFAVVRGLADRYITTLFNGAAISSADPSRKAVQLDIFPTTAIQGIDINKTYRPELPGDFGGGTIQINSLSIPEERFAEFKYKLTGNSNLEDRMLVHPNRELGFWGDVDNPIPDSLVWNLDANGDPETFNTGGNRITPGNTSKPNQRQAQINAGQAQQELADAALPGVIELHNSQEFMPKEVEPEDAESFSLVYGDRFKYSNGNEFGFVGAFQHATHDEVNDFGEENRLTSPARSWTEESYAREVDWSLYLAGGLKLGENNQFKATYFHKRIATDEVTHGTDYNVEGDGVLGAPTTSNSISRYGATAIYNKEFWTIDPIIRDTELAQISGQHKNDVGTRFSWSLTSSTARESRPHTSNFQNGELDFTDPQIAALAAVDPNVIYNPSLGKVSTIEYQTFVNDGIGSLDSSRATQFIEEQALEGSVDLVQSIYFTDEEEDGEHIDLAVGATSIDKNREQEGRVYLMRTASWERWVQRNPPAWWTSNSGVAPYSPGSPLSGTTLADGSPLPDGFNSLGEYLAAHPEALADYFNGYAGETVGAVPGTGTGSARANYVQPDAPYYLNGSGLEVRNVDSDLNLTALYTSGTYYGDFWRFGGGARWEEEVKKYEVAPSPLTRLLENDPARYGSMTTNAFIPALYGGLDLAPEKSWLNLALSRTVARPTFHEFLPIESIDQSTGVIRRGNPNLVETTIENLDASIEMIFSESFNGTISLFGKRLADPIVEVQRTDVGRAENSNTYINGDEGTVKGFELESRWKPENQPFSLTGNYSFIDSTLKYSVNQGLVVTPLETRFPYQPRQILNLTLGWEPVDSPWSAFLTTNFTDEYPTILRSEPSAYDVWLKSQLTLDLIVARKFEFDWFTGTLTFGLRNLTDSDHEYEYRGGTPEGDGGPLEGLTYTTDSPGISYSIEFKAAF